MCHSNLTAQFCLSQFWQGHGKDNHKQAKLCRRDWIVIIASSQQLKFRRLHSTTDAVLNLVESKDSSQKRQGTTAIFLNIVGAYDNAAHDILLAKLHGKNCDTSLLNWITSYLGERAFKTVNTGNKSSKFWTTKGVPQGSPISPLLFSQYMDDLLRELNKLPRIHSQANADDVVLMTASCSCAKTVVPAQMAPTAAAAWATGNNMNLLPRRPTLCISVQRTLCLVHTSCRYMHQQTTKSATTNWCTKRIFVAACNDSSFAVTIICRFALRS